MAIGFIWKKQLLWLFTLFLVIALGLGIGAMLHDRFQEGSVVADGNGAGGAMGGVPGAGKSGANGSVKTNAQVAVPSLPYPTTKPGTSVPKGNPPSGK